MTPAEPSILFAYAFNGKGGGVPLSAETISAELETRTLTWVHMNADHADTRTWLEREVTYLDPIILDALLAEETRPRVLDFPEGILVILRGVNYNPGAEPEDMVSIRLWIDPYRIISLRKRSLRAIHNIRTALDSGHGPRTAGDFLATLCSEMFELMEPAILELSQEIDQLEQKVLDHPDQKLRLSIIESRKVAIDLKRYIAPQRDVLLHLHTSDHPWLNSQHKREFLESYDRVLRYVDQLEAVREHAQIVKEELGNMLADELSRNLYTLSAIAGIFLPLNTLTSLFGANVGGIPGSTSNIGFWVLTASLLVVAAVQIYIFKRKKWL